MINIFIYQDEPSQSLDIDRISQFLNAFKFKTIIRENLFDKKNIDYSNYLNSIKIKDIEVPLDKRHNAESLIMPENISGDVRENFFDGFWLQRILTTYLFKNYPDEIRDDCLHIVLTGKLFGTFGTRRYHARVLLTGEPCILSTSGIVEAPARPREYYFAKARLMAEGRDISDLDEIFAERFVEYDSPKITDITCSYILQLIKYRYTGEPFCSGDKCCLYNSHWQEEVLSLQYSKEICDECSKILKI